MLKLDNMFGFEFGSYSYNLLYVRTKASSFGQIYQAFGFGHIYNCRFF